MFSILNLTMGWRVNEIWICPWIHHLLHGQTFLPKWNSRSYLCMSLDFCQAWLRPMVNSKYTSREVSACLILGLIIAIRVKPHSCTTPGDTHTKPAPHHAKSTHQIRNSPFKSAPNPHQSGWSCTNKISLRMPYFAIRPADCTIKNRLPQ